MKAETLEAMNAGRDVIAQAYLALEPFAGFPDLLVREKVRLGLTTTKSGTPSYPAR